MAAGGARREADVGGGPTALPARHRRRFPSPSGVMNEVTRVTAFPFLSFVLGKARAPQRQHRQHRRGRKQNAGLVVLSPVRGPPPRPCSPSGDTLASPPHPQVGVHRNAARGGRALTNAARTQGASHRRFARVLAETQTQAARRAGRSDRRLRKAGCSLTGPGLLTCSIFLSVQ